MNRAKLIEGSAFGYFGKTAMKAAFGGVGVDFKPAKSWGTEYDVTDKVNGILTKMAGQISASSDREMSF